jgi:hypothetical protein
VSFSPALTDAVELRWVNEQNENGSEGVERFPSLGTLRQPWTDGFEFMDIAAKR